MNYNSVNHDTATIIEITKFKISTYFKKTTIIEIKTRVHLILGNITNNLHLLPEIDIDFLHKIDYNTIIRWR